MSVTTVVFSVDPPADESWKSAEILLLPHQLTVLQRHVDVRPKMTWADRALIALLHESSASRWIGACE